MSLGTFKDLCIDATDAAALGRFWSVVLGLELHHQADGDADLTGPTPAHTVWINQVSEPKSAKHRTHLDVYGSSAPYRLHEVVVDCAQRFHRGRGFAAATAG